MNKTKLFSLWQLGLALLLSLGLTVFVLRGGWSLGFFLAVLLTETVFLAWLRLPAGYGQMDSPAEPAPASSISRPGPQVPAALQAALALIVTDLGLCFLLYDNILLKVLNTLVIMVLLAVQFLLGARVFDRPWSEPGFWIEALVSCLARPWICLEDFGHSLFRLFTRQSPAASQLAGGQPAPAARRPLGKVFLGLLLAVPVLLISGSLLSAADPVFARIFLNLQNYLTELSLNDLFKTALTTLILLPFIFSFLYSGFSHWRLLPAPAAGQPTGKGFRLDKTVLITFLTCINLLYLIFAIVQLAYLTGAFTASLPENLTYAEYARSGFFELAFISVINLALILLAVKGADRQGLTGFALRIESLLLVAGSLIQWLSAMFRMHLYVDTYGLTQLRFMVTAFMILLLVLFALLLVKEFRFQFPLFKAFTAVTLASLLILNHVNSDAWIANHNVTRYAASQKIDTDYFKELSQAAVPAMLQLTETATPAVAADVAGQLLRRYAGSLEHYADGRWQKLNVAQEQARRMLAANLDRLKALNPEAAGSMDEWRATVD